MQSAVLLAAVVVGTGLVACVGTYALIPVLRRAAVLDRPNQRSSHETPTPRGGGIAVVAAILGAWLILLAMGAVAWPLIAVVFAAALLAAISWLDDLHGLSPALRLAAQVVAVAFGMLALGSAGPVFQGWLPVGLDAAAAMLLWVWFINLYNFMDGIDGLAGSEGAAVGTGLALFAFLGAGHDLAFATLAAAIAASAIGFLVWNWAPARIFLGDVGSVPLGYLLGFLLLAAAAHGYWKLALILPLYFLADSTITLLRRLARGERVWQAHREHFYQRAVRRGLSHAAVVQRVIAADLLLIACGWVAEGGHSAIGLTAAAAVVLVLLASMIGMPTRGS